jgi:hypothetical protein
LCRAIKVLRPAAFRGVRVSRVRFVAAVLLLGLATSFAGEAQQSASLQPGVRATPATISKAELAGRFQDIKTRYAALKAAAAKFAPLKADAPTELRVVRSKISAAMRSYELNEAQAQKHRDRLNLLTELSEPEAMRLQAAMDRLANMGGLIRRLMNQVNESGDALALNARQ